MRRSSRFSKFWLTSYEDDVQLALFRLGLHNLRASVPGSIVAVVTIAWLTRATVPADRWSLWLGVELVAMATGLIVLASFWRWRQADAAPDAATRRRWMWSHIGLISLQGAGAGSVGLLYVTGHTTQNLLIATAFVGAGAFSAVGNAAHNLPAFMATVVIAMSVMSGLFPIAFGDDTPVILLLCWLYAVMLAWTAVKAHQTLVDTLRLRLAHEAMAHRAEQASRDKSDFLAAASHDLRQPVHALVLLIEALRQRRAAPQTASAAEQDGLIHSIGEAAQAIRQLFDGLMELSRLESGREQPVPVPLQPAALLRQVAAHHEAQAERQGLRLRVRISRAARDAWVMADRVMLERSLVNLLANALRYTPQGGVLLTLRHRGDGALAIGVQDTGIGIAAVDQARIFEPYVQLANPERDRQRGLGLGLAIVRECVRRLGIDLALRSRPGHGSSFLLTLPATLACDAPHDPRTAATVAVDAAALAGCRVLLIDDDAMVRAAMRSLMAGWQVDLRLAVDANDPALAGLDGTGWAPDVVLSDHRLSGEVQGIELLDRLLDRWPASRALLMTGEPPERVQAPAEDAGYPVLYKPVSPALLASTLQALLPR